MLSRRAFLALIGAGALIPGPLLAQQKRVRRIGYLANDPNRDSPTFQAFIGGLRELGWAEGKNLEIHYLTSGGRDELFPSLATAALRLDSDVIVTTGSPSTAAARKATDKIPIVFGSAGNPVEQKFVSSLARPGGNITGLALLVQELGPKQLEYIKVALPHATNVARLFDPGSLASRQPAIMAEEDAAAEKLGMSLQHIPIKNLEQIDGAFEWAARHRMHAVRVTAASVFVVNRALVAKLALHHRVPLMGPDARFAEAGALLSYGENFSARYRRAAFMVDKILRGTKPAEIPVEQPEEFELAVNVATAKALGVAMPHFLLQVARVVKRSDPYP